MIQSQSKLFGQTKKEAPKEAETANHRLLVQGGFIDQLAAGVWSLLPLGFRCQKKIENIIREEMEKIGGQEIFLPSLQPKNLWQETERWETIDPPLFLLQDRHKKEYGLGPTHEEVITDLARRMVSSYKQLPFAIFQIQNKFRNELRSSGGLLRVREFMMKDLYSFHSDEKSLDDYYQKVHQSYLNIFRRCGLEAVPVEAESGTIGGNFCHEFMVIAESGEDKVFVCPKCGWAINTDVAEKNLKSCPKCQAVLANKKAIEAGHIFKLGQIYSQKMKAGFLDQNGQKKDLQMGCYGIGLGRLLATVVEASHDQDGVIWPVAVSPYHLHLLQLNDSAKTRQETEKVLDHCQQNQLEVLFDDRQLRPGEKLKDADLIGISLRVVVSEKTVEQSLIEVKKRAEQKSELVPLNKLKEFVTNAK